MELRKENDSTVIPLVRVDSAPVVMASNPVKIESAGTDGTVADPLSIIKTEPLEDETPDAILPDRAYMNPEFNIESNEQGVVAAEMGENFITKTEEKLHLSPEMEAPLEMCLQVEDVPLVVNVEDKEMKDSYPGDLPSIVVNASEACQNLVKKKSYICEPCGKDFKQRYNLKIHFNAVHRKEKPFECPVCLTKFTQKSSLKRHISNIHMKRKPYWCTHCGTNIAVVKRGGEHMASKQGNNLPSECQHCRKKFASQISGATFLKQKNGKQKQTFPKDKTKRSMSQKTSVKKCIRKENDRMKSLEKKATNLDESSTQCHCDSVPEPQVLSDSRKVRVVEERLKIIPERMQHESHEQPENIQDREDPLLKNTCEETPNGTDPSEAGAWTCYNCLKNQHSGYSGKALPLVFTGQTTYKCEQCEKEFIYDSSKGYHTVIHIIPKPESPETVERKHECMLCEKKFAVRGVLEKHVRTVHLKEKQYECMHCGQKFGQSGDMKYHIRSVHLKLKQYECQYCGLKFGRRYDVKKHIRTVHLKEKLYKCEHCGQMFALKTSMKAHVQTVHLKEKLFKCHYCGQRFGEKGNMKAHVRTVHLKVKKYGCQYCGQRFGWSSDMKKHVRIVHMKEKQFECQHCWQKFGEKGSMKKHIQTAHVNEKTNCRPMDNGLVLIDN